MLSPGAPQGGVEAKVGQPRAGVGGRRRFAVGHEQLRAFEAGSRPLTAVKGEEWDQEGPSGG